MKVCSSHHESIAFNVNLQRCPMCDMLDKNFELLDDVKNLRETVEELEYEREILLSRVKTLTDNE